MKTLLFYLSEQLEIVNYKPLWIGANVIGKIEGITDKTAFIRPMPEIHSVAEIIGHLTALNISIANKVRTKYNIQQSYQPNDWRAISELKTIGWQQLWEGYEKSVLSLSVLIRDKDDSFLQETYMEDDHRQLYSFQYALEGIIHHTLYHLGQIGITIKLLIKKELHI